MTRFSNLTVLHVGKYYPPHMGGIETHVRDLCHSLVRTHKVQVLVSSADRKTYDEDIDGVAVSRLANTITLFSTPICASMVSRIRATDADIIQIHLPNPAAVAAYLLSGHRGRLICTYHSDTIRQKMLGSLVEPMLHAVLRRSSAIIATSPDYVRTSPVLSRHLDRCHVIPLGIAVDDFAHCNPDAASNIRRLYGDRLVISVGRLVSYKGFEYLIGAMARVQGALLLVGEGPLRGKLEKFASEMGVASKVHFLGKVDHNELVASYHAADVFALASVARSEAFGIVQVEAMAAGLPVVNTQLNSGVPFVSIHEQTGLTVPPGDSEALAGAINRLLDDPELRNRLGAAAQQRARREFTLDIMASRTRNLYEAVMEKPLATPVSNLATNHTPLKQNPTAAIDLQVGARSIRR